MTSVTTLNERDSNRSPSRQPDLDLSDELGSMAEQTGLDVAVPKIKVLSTLNPSSAFQVEGQSDDEDGDENDFDDVDRLAISENTFDDSHCLGDECSPSLGGVAADISTGGVPSSADASYADLNGALENAMIKSPSFGNALGGISENILNTMDGAESLRRNCPNCGVTFYSKRQLCEHLRDMHGVDKPFQCEICFARFPYSSSLYNHTRIHSELRPFKCNLCDSAFRWKNSLKHHKRFIHKVIWSDEDDKTDVTFAMAAKERYGTTALDQVVVPPFPYANNHSLRRLENFSGPNRRGPKTNNASVHPSRSGTGNPIVPRQVSNSKSATMVQIKCELPPLTDYDKNDKNIKYHDHFYGNNLIRAVNLNSLTGISMVSNNANSIHNNSNNNHISVNSSKTFLQKDPETDEQMLDKKKRKKQMVESIVKKLCITNTLNTVAGEVDDSSSSPPTLHTANTFENSQTIPKTISIRTTSNNGIVYNTTVSTKSDARKDSPNSSKSHVNTDRSFIDTDNSNISVSRMASDDISNVNHRDINKFYQASTSSSMALASTDEYRCELCKGEFTTSTDLERHECSKSAQNSLPSIAANATRRRNGVVVARSQNDSATNFGFSPQTSENGGNAAHKLSFSKKSISVTTSSSCDQCIQLGNRLVVLEQRFDEYQRTTQEKITSLEGTISDLYEICANNGIVL
uniref:C2H2-type domain-containing protein n=1 Tax=Romanomermis culicivorax TaxID=13658 RepID=A0A915HKS8_ROMCU